MTATVTFKEVKYSCKRKKKTATKIQMTNKNNT